MLAPSGFVCAEIAGERLDAPRHLRWRDNRRESARGAIAIRVAQRHGQGAVAAHGVTENGLPDGIDRKMLGDQLRQFLRDIAPHAVIFCKRLLRRAKPEIIGVRGIAGHIRPPRAGVRRDEDQSEFGARPAIFAFFRDVGVGAGQARQIPDHWQLRAVLVRRNKDRKGHVGLGLAA